MTLTLRERITRRSIPFQTLAALASERGFTVFPGDVSKWVTAPESVHAKKAERLAAVFQQIEEMLDGVKVRPDLRDANVVRTALVEFENHKVKEVDAVPVAPSAIFTPLWPAKSKNGVRPSNAAALLQQ